MELKGFILWNKDLKRVGYVHSTRAGAEFSLLKKCFTDAFDISDRSRVVVSKEWIENLADVGMELRQASPHEIREVTVIIKETDEKANTQEA